MNNNLNFHKKLLKDLKITSSIVDPKLKITGCDGATLNATLFKSKSESAILMIPGMWQPRETLYKIAHSLNKKNMVLVYDQRAHSYSEGQFNIQKMVKDCVLIAEKLKTKKGIKKISIIGHSLGGYVAAMVGSLSSDLINHQVFLTPPVSLSKLSERVPKLSTFKVYAMNLYKALKPKYRDKIVRHYVSFWWPTFKKSPYFFGLRYSDSKNLADEMRATQDLVEYFNKKIKTLCVFTGKDSTLKIDKALPDEYRRFIDTIEKEGAEYEFYPHLSHQLNVNSRKGVFISGDNELVLQRLGEFLNNHAH